MGRYRSVTVTVDVDMGDIDTDDLVEELQSRGKQSVVSEATIPPLSGEDRHPLHELYYALKFGLNDKALDLARTYTNDQLGTAL